MTQLSSVLEENNKSVLAEQTKLMIEQNKMNQIITEIANKPSITNNNNNNHNHTSNNQFNMNMFLNETCKDAMNMSEFIENLTVTVEDMEMTGTHLYRDWETDRKSTRLNSSHSRASRMPSSA